VIGNALPIGNATGAISSNNYVILSGPGSMIQVGADALKIGHMAFSGNNWMTIDDHAVCITPSTILGNSTNVNNNSLSISSGGIMTNTVSFHLGGQNNFSNVGSYNQVNVTNNGLLYVEQYMYIGTGPSTNNTLWVDSSRCVVKRDLYIGGTTNSFGNQAIISDGATLETGWSLRLGNNGGDGGRLTLRNASATVGTACLVGNIGGSIIADNRLVFEGTNGTLSAQTDLSVKNGGGIHVVLPEEGRSTDAPFITGSGVVNFDESTRLLIDASALHRKLATPRTYVLLRNVNPINMMIDADNMILEPEGSVKVAQSADGREIRFSVFPYGTMIILR
jgi:hypothetical protein